MMLALETSFPDKEHKEQLESMWKLMAETIWPGNCRDMFIEDDVAFPQVATHRDIFFWFRDRGGCFATLARLLDAKNRVPELRRGMPDVAFRTPSAIWRALATNACSSRHVFDELYASFEVGPGNGARLSRDIAIGLVSTIPPVRPQPPQQFLGQLPHPKLRVEDLLMVFQVDHVLRGEDGDVQHKALASYCITDLAGLFESRNEKVELILDGKAGGRTAPFFFEGENPMASGYAQPDDGLQGLDPIQRASSNAMGNLLTSCRFFRKDGERLQHVCVLRKGNAGDGELGRAFAPNGSEHPGSVACYLESDEASNQIPRLATGTVQSRTARQMASLRHCNNIYFLAEIELSSRPIDIPPPIDGWTRTLRNHHELEPRPDSDCPEWSEQERRELSRIEHFRFQATKLVVSFNAWEDADDGFTCHLLSTTDKLLFFEGLDWK